jgi:hypothetical protein
MSDDAEVERGPEITHEKARESARRLINSAFQQEPRARLGIPARPGYDDDLVIVAYIEQQSALRPAPPAQDALVEAIRERDEARRQHGIWMNAARELLERAEAAEAQVTSLRAAIQSALAIDERVGETADGAMIEVLTGALSTLPSSSVETARQHCDGDPSGPGSSPSVEPASGLDASHSIPIAERPDYSFLVIAVDRYGQGWVVDGAEGFYECDFFANGAYAEDAGIFVPGGLSVGLYRVDKIKFSGGSQDCAGEWDDLEVSGAWTSLAQGIVTEGGDAQAAPGAKRVEPGGEADAPGTSVSVERAREAVIEAYRRLASAKDADEYYDLLGALNHMIANLDSLTPGEKAG